jgi:hypothetical protein
MLVWVLLVVMTLGVSMLTVFTVLVLVRDSVSDSTESST